MVSGEIDLSLNIDPDEDVESVSKATLILYTFRYTGVSVKQQEEWIQEPSIIHFFFVINRSSV